MDPASTQGPRRVMEAADFPACGQSRSTAAQGLVGAARIGWSAYVDLEPIGARIRSHGSPHDGSPWAHCSSNHGQGLTPRTPRLLRPHWDAFDMIEVRTGTPTRSPRGGGTGGSCSLNGPGRSVRSSQAVRPGQSKPRRQCSRPIPLTSCWTCDAARSLLWYARAVARWPRSRLTSTSPTSRAASRV